MAEEDLHVDPGPGRRLAHQPGRAARPQRGRLRVRLPPRRRPRHRPGRFLSQLGPRLRELPRPARALPAPRRRRRRHHRRPDRRQRHLRQQPGAHRRQLGGGRLPPARRRGLPAPFAVRRAGLRLSPTRRRFTHGLQPGRDGDPDPGGLRKGHERVVRQLPPRHAAGQRHRRHGGAPPPGRQRGQAARLVPDQLHRLREDGEHRQRRLHPVLPLARALRGRNGRLREAEGPRAVGRHVPERTRLALEHQLPLLPPRPRLGVRLHPALRRGQLVHHGERRRGEPGVARPRHRPRRGQGAHRHRDAGRRTMAGTPPPSPRSRPRSATSAT